ncbi:palmitoyltransferase ZDHHC11-like isoform X2 [Macrotis lagotis]|uniref:palmitoyltransferase ZDHHC11-like isoform X2 n=1 Tax=Macrotis lagotis TaxID=92651 RepID=UPI003D6835CE
MATSLCWKNLERTFCKWKFRRVWPEDLVKQTKTISPPRVSRVNGWSLPLHPFQFIAWAAYVYMIFTAYAFFIPLLPYFWRNITYIVTGILFGLHFVVHIIAVTIDPADPNVRHKSSYGTLMPTLDRTKHKHVIQNQYCHLCEVTVGVKAKHCSACNKCIADFDHHCKWLNNCVGSRNYWYFFTSVASAVLGTLVLIILLMYVCIQYFVKPEELRRDSQFEMGRKLSTFDYMTQGRPKTSTGPEIKISIPLKSPASETESGVSAGQKKTSSSQGLCKINSSREKSSFYSLRGRSFCLGLNEDLSQTCFSLMTVTSANKCQTETPSENEEKSKDATEKREHNASFSEESPNQEPYSSGKPLSGSPKLNSLTLLFCRSLTQQDTIKTSEEFLKDVEKQ